MASKNEYLQEVKERLFFSNPTRLQSLRNWWRSVGMEGLFKNVLIGEVEAAYAPYMAMDGAEVLRVKRPHTILKLEKPFLYSEVVFRYKAGTSREHHDIDDNSWYDVFFTRNGLSVARSENWVYTQYLDHEPLQTRPERVHDAMSMRELLEKQIKRERRVRVRGKLPMYTGY